MKAFCLLTTCLLTTISATPFNNSLIEREITLNQLSECGNLKFQFLPTPLFLLTATGSTILPVKCWKVLVEYTEVNGFYPAIQNKLRHITLTMSELLEQIDTLYSTLLQKVYTIESITLDTGFDSNNYKGTIRALSVIGYTGSLSVVNYINISTNDIVYEYPKLSNLEVSINTPESIKSVISILKNASLTRSITFHVSPLRNSRDHPFDELVLLLHKLRHLESVTIIGDNFKFTNIILTLGYIPRLKHLTLNVRDSFPYLVWNPLSLLTFTLTAFSQDITASPGFRQFFMRLTEIKTTIHISTDEYCPVLQAFVMNRGLGLSVALRTLDELQSLEVNPMIRIDLGKQNEALEMIQSHLSSHIILELISNSPLTSEQLGYIKSLFRVLADSHSIENIELHILYKQCIIQPEQDFSHLMSMIEILVGGRNFVFNGYQTKYLQKVFKSSPSIKQLYKSLEKTEYIEIGVSSWIDSVGEEGDQFLNSFDKRIESHENMFELELD